MNINRIIKQKEEGDGSSNGGGSFVKAPTLFKDEPTKGDADNTDSAGDGDDYLGGIGLHDFYDKLDGKGKHGKSAIFETIQRSEGKKTSEEDGSDKEDGTEEKDPITNEDKKEEKRLSDEDILKAEAVNKNGTKITVQSSQLINGLKERVREFSEKIKQYESPEVKSKLSEYDSLKTQLTEKDERIKALQSQIDEEHFENSEGFKEVYSKPLEKTAQKISAFFKIQTLKKDGRSDEIAKIQSAWDEASKYAGQGDYTAYLEAIDSISDSHIEGGTAFKNAFSREAEKYFEQFHEYTKAHLEKGDNRKKIVEDRMQDMRSKSVSTIEHDVTKFVQKFEADNKILIDSLPDELKSKYIGSYKDKEKFVKSAMAQFAVTGKLPEALHSIIANGVAFEAVHQEKVLAWGAFNDATNKIKILETELNEAKSRLKKYTGEPSKGSQRYSNSVSVGEKKEKGSGSAIFDRMQAMGQD